jgi:uncharacterized membrane protein SirB2
MKSKGVARISRKWTKPRRIDDALLLIAGLVPHFTTGVSPQEEQWRSVFTKNLLLMIGQLVSPRFPLLSHFIFCLLLLN